MEVLNSTYDLLEEFASFFLFELLLLHYVIKELSSTYIFHDEEELFWSFNDFEKLNDIGMTNEF